MRPLPFSFPPISFPYDPAGNQTQRVNRDNTSTTISAFTYGFNGVNDRTSQVASTGDDSTWTYDAIRQLLGDQYAWGTYSFQYAGCHCRQPVVLRMRGDFGCHWRSLWAASVFEREPTLSMLPVAQHWRVKALASGTRRTLENGHQGHGKTANN